MCATYIGYSTPEALISLTFLRISLGFRILRNRSDAKSVSAVRTPPRIYVQVLTAVVVL